MYTRKQLQLHERSIAVLELIQDAKKRFENSRHDLYIFDNCNNPYSTIRLMCNRPELTAKVKKYEAIRDRLVMWYADIMQRLFEEAMFRIGKSKSVVEIAEEVYA